MNDSDTADNVPDGTFANLMSEKPKRSRRAPNKRKNERTNVATNKATLQRSNGGSKQRSSNDDAYSITVPATRQKIRATYDLFVDQQEALSKLQLAAVDAGEKKPKLSDMMQEAVDNYVRKRARDLGNVTVIRDSATKTRQ